MNIIVAISTGTLSAGLLYKLGSENWLLYGVFTMSSTMAVYNGQRLFKASSSIQTPWLAWVNRNKQWLFLLSLFFGLVALSVLYFLMQPTMEIILLLGSASLISAFYVIRIGGINMREIPFIKIHLISLTWTLILVVFPLFNEGIQSNWKWIALGHYLYVLAVTIPFDIRDLKYDLPKQRTIPQLVGVTWSKVLALCALGGFVVISFTVFPDLQLNPIFYVAIAAQALLILGMNEQRSDLYCAGAIDGAILLLGLSYFWG